MVNSKVEYKMRYRLLTLMLLSSFFVNAQELEFTGKLSGLQKNTKVILTDLRSLKANSPEQRFHDTALVSDGLFKFKTVLPGAGMYLLRVALIGQNPEHRKFYLDGGKVQLEGKRGGLNEATLSSDAKYIKDFVLFTDIMDRAGVFARRKALKDTAMMRMAETGSYDGYFNSPGLRDRMSKVEKETIAKATEIAMNWIIEYPNSDINAYVIHTFLRSKTSDKIVKDAIAKLSPSARRSFPGKMLINL